MFNAERSYFKTVREIELEQKVLDLERALMRQKYGSDPDIAIMPPCEELIRQHAAPEAVTVKLPRVVSIECEWDKQRYPRHLRVAARVTVPEPFGLNYYCDAALLSTTVSPPRCSPSTTSGSCGSWPSSCSWRTRRTRHLQIPNARFLASQTGSKLHEMWATMAAIFGRCVRQRGGQQ